MAANPNEALFAQGTPIGADLQTGVEAISIQQTITFTKYIRLVLPLDGYVFWVKSDIVSQGALYNAAKINGAAYSQSQKIITPAPTTIAKGSLHYATDIRQDESETYAVNRVVFTSEQPVQDLNQIGPNVIFIAEFDGIKFAFSQRGSFYQQAELWHYVGNAIYSDMETQIIDKLDGFDAQNVVVSNSLPAWLFLNGYQPFYGFASPVTLYPSFIVPTNLLPPYGSVHIDPINTKAIASTGRLDPNSSHSQLATDTVRVTLWGTRNFNAQDFVDCVNQYSLDYDVIGIQNMPIVRDEKRTQVELAAIGQKKTIEFEVSYYQSAVRDIARQIIQQAFVTYQPTGFVAA